MKVRLCELCNAKAAVFCPSDAAFLCWTCDSKVHEANFLVARHVRRALCSNCNSYTADFVSARPSACPSCPPASPADDDLGSLSSTSSSACASSTTSPAAKLCSGDSSSTVTLAKRRRTTSKPRLNQLKAEGVFAGWCGKLGIETGAVARAASRALKVCADRWTAVPFRVCLAASMWLGLRLSLEKSELTWRILKRLEEISGVPPKIILASVSKLERVVRGGELDPRRRLELEEGWAEC